MKKNIEESMHMKKAPLDTDAFSVNKRTVERIQKNIFVKFFCGHSAYTGIIMNLSEKGMFISTKEDFPLKPKLEILIPLKEEILKVNGKIKSSGKAGKIYNGIGIELSKPNQDYLKFIGNLRTLY